MSRAAPKIAYETTSNMLLMPYLVMPVAILIVIIDQLFLGQWIKHHFITTPETQYLYLTFFNLHIMASTITFVDMEYLRHYWRRLMLFSVLICAVIMPFAHPQGNDVFNLIFVAWTAVHTTGQQFGLIRLMGLKQTPLHTVWKWLAILVSMLVYCSYFSLYFITPEGRHYIQIFMWAALFLFLSLSYGAYKPAHTPMLKLYILGNIAAVVLSVALYSIYYSLLAVLMGRVIHDVSAFIFYILHDMNRNRTKARNIFFRAFRFTHIPIYVLGPLGAFLLAYPISYFSFFHPQEIMYKIFAFLAMMHYCTDSSVWKKGSPHRDYIRVAPA
jgi:hypothetical protein